MRTIKFRGKRVDNGEWIYGYGYVKDYFNDNEFIAITGDPIFQHMDMIRVEHETVGQFTGLYDKNGTEIYEGDIINCNYDDIEVWDTPSLRITITSCVEYIGSSFMIEKVYYLDYLNSDALEVIGNIHDNKEIK